MRRAIERARAFSDNAVGRLVQTLPPSALLPLGLAIFTLFSSLGWVTDVINGGRSHPLVLIVNGTAGGLIGLGYAFGSMRRKWGLFAAIIVFNLVYARFAAKLFGPLPTLPPAAVPGRLAFDGVAVLVSVALSYACFLWFINGTAARYLGVQAEIALAREIHQVLVPIVDRRLGGFEFYGFSHASGEVGGDLVDVVPLGRPGGWFGYVADVSGHGVSSGLVMGMFKSALRMRLLQEGTLSSMLGDLNTVLVPLKSGSMFVTAACVRSTGAGDLEFAVAGHLPILRVTRGARDAGEITTPQIPVGIFDDFAFTSSTLACGPGDLLALITDGLTEVFDAQDRELGMDAIKRVLAESASRPLPEIADRLVSAARAHGAQIDDQTLLLIRRT